MKRTPDPLLYFIFSHAKLLSDKMYNNKFVHFFCIEGRTHQDNYVDTPGWYIFQIFAER